MKKTKSDSSKKMGKFPPKSPTYFITKRLFDILGGIFGLIVSFLPIVVLSFFIKKDKGPIFFSQERIGLNGKKFKMYKLRSMVLNADKLKDELLKQNQTQGATFKMKDDPRITKVGKFIRHYSLDELPQFWNVLKGDMSLVGPRPALEREVKKYSNYDKQRLSAKPGLSGLWQVSGRSELSFHQMVNLDLKYIKKRSIPFDFKITFKTLKIILSSKNSGAY